MMEASLFSMSLMMHDQRRRQFVGVYPDDVPGEGKWTLKCQKRRTPFNEFGRLCPLSRLHSCFAISWTSSTDPLRASLKPGLARFGRGAESASSPPHEALGYSSRHSFRQAVLPVVGWRRFGTSH